MTELSSNSRQTSQQLDTQTRRSFVLSLRKSGATYRQIAQAAEQQFGADALPRGWDERYAYNDIARELEKLKTLNSGLTEDVRELEVQRLDELLLSMWPQAKKGNQGAVDRVLRIMERRARLLGLDAPTRADVTSGGEAIKANVIVVREYINDAQSD